MTDIQLILDCLNHHKIRATYGAVGELMGIPAIGVGRYLGNPRAEASWIVSASSGKPSGYDQSEYHPALFHRQEVLRKGQALQKLLGGKTLETPAQKKTSAVPPPASKVISHRAIDSDYQIAGIDLAWISEKNGSGIAIGVIADRKITLQELHCGIIGLENVQRILDSCRTLRGVAVGGRRDQ